MSMNENVLLEDDTLIQMNEPERKKFPKYRMKFKTIPARIVNQEVLP